MRHAASLLAAMEGISRAAFRVAKELANNSRSGLTIRFLSKKLEIPDEEVEYIVDVNHRILFVDLTKIKIVPEGINAIRRILRGLENRGDVPSLYRHVKSLSAQEFRELEDLAGLDGPVPKKTAVEKLLEHCYKHPDALVSYVATRGFSATAREVFDIVWQSKEGVMPVSKIRSIHGGSEYEIEQALSEMFRGLALFEMFRFDAEDRLVRVAGLLSEIRQWRDETASHADPKGRLKPQRISPYSVTSNGLGFSEQICRLVASIAAKPARLRGDGDLFREDRRRLADICPEEGEPPLTTCLWAAQGVAWLARVDNELRAGQLDDLLKLDAMGRHTVVCDWLLSGDRDGFSRRQVTALLEELKPAAWYQTLDVVRHAMSMSGDDTQPALKLTGGYWRYASSVASPHSERSLARALEETLLWLGIVDRAEENGNSYVRVTDLGLCLLTGKPLDDILDKFASHRAHIIVQPNFDIVVPTHDMDPLITVPLDQFAVRSSTGKATVYHLSKDTFTRGVQEGHDGEAFVEFLLAHNKGGRLPSNVMTTLEDWRGGMKRVRLRTIQVLETDDALILADLLNRRRFKKVITAIDPQKTAAYSKIAKAELAKQLEKEGFIVD
jgi:hypothetical protein